MRLIALLLAASCWLNMVFAAPLKIVAAENFYGELAQEIGGNQVSVVSIISNPAADPHLFATAPSISLALSQAQIIIYNGAGYDDWLKPLLAVNAKVNLINVAELMHIKAGQNPHLWYKPETFKQLALVLAAQINQARPAAKAQTTANLQRFLAQQQQLEQLIAHGRASYAGVSVIATEPVYGYMAAALGLNMHGLDFQWKIMNDSEPSPKMIVNYQDLLRGHQVKVLFYNNQVVNALTQNMRALAQKNGVITLGVNETMPRNMTVTGWLTATVNATLAALAASIKS